MVRPGAAQSLRTMRENSEKIRKKLAPRKVLRGGFSQDLNRSLFIIWENNNVSCDRFASSNCADQRLRQSAEAG
jgi:hypothetical protein